MQSDARRLTFPPYELWETRGGRGAPVALIHGLSGSSRWWSRNFEALAEHHLAAAVDLVGFGRTSHFLGTPVLMPPFSEVTALLARWLETFGEPVHVIGHSMGGQIAIRLAAERPDLVRSLILVDASGMPFHLDPRPHFRPLPRPPYGGPGILRVLLPDFLRAGPASVAVASTRVMLGDMREKMQAIRVPTLLVWGQNDPLVPLQFGEAMQREIAGSRLAVIPNAAHVAMWDAPEEFNRIALEFLADVESRARIEEAGGVSPRGVFSWGIAGWTEIASVGMAHRQAGPRRDLVLIHGLGLSSAYFRTLAASLFAEGWNPISPDLPGFGESSDAPAVGPEEHARNLRAWADALGIRNAVWLGHSIGCNVVAHLARMRPDLVRKAVFVGPLWTRSRTPKLRTLTRLALDGFREPLALYPYVLRAYWRTGFLRWWRTAHRFAHDIGCDLSLPADSIVLAGTRDPIPDRTCLAVEDVPGAHACVFSDPQEISARMGGGPHDRDGILQRPSP